MFELYTVYATENFVINERYMSFFLKKQLLRKLLANKKEEKTFFYIADQANKPFSLDVRRSTCDSYDY